MNKLRWVGWGVAGLVVYYALLLSPFFIFNFIEENLGELNRNSITFVFIEAFFAGLYAFDSQTHSKQIITLIQIFFNPIFFVAAFIFTRWFVGKLCSRYLPNFRKIAHFFITILVLILIWTTYASVLTVSKYQDRLKMIEDEKVTSGENCESFSDEKSQYRCLTSRVARTDDPVVCGQVKDQLDTPSYNESDQCFFGVAVRTKNTNTCLLIDDQAVGQTNRDHCLSSVAQATKDPQICQLIPVNSNTYFGCYIAVARVSEDSTICDKIENGKNVPGHVSNAQGYVIEGNKIDECKQSVEKYINRYEDYR